MNRADLATIFGICECKQCTYKPKKTPVHKPGTNRFAIASPALQPSVLFYAYACNRSDARSIFKKRLGLKTTVVSTVTLELKELTR